MILMGTGHRPDKLAGWRAGPNDSRTWQLRYAIRDYLREQRPDRVISGMAQGFDLYLAFEALNAGIPLTAAQPTRDHGANWPADSIAKASLGRVLSRAKEIVSVGGGKSFAELGPAAYHARNVWMLDHATHILACWDGSAGGTSACLMSNKRRARPLPVVNIWHPGFAIEDPDRQT